MGKECGCKVTDRYVSFEGIDCVGNAQRVMDFIDKHRAIPGHGNAFWEYFANKRNPRSGPQPDNLLLIHSNINEIRELFETWEDVEALALLQQLEDECC